MRAVVGQPPVAARLQQMPRGVLARAWVAVKGEAYEEWAPTDRSRTWRRRGAAGSYEYYFVFKRAEDHELEMKWLSAQQFADGGIEVPGVAAGGAGSGAATDTATADAGSGSAGEMTAAADGGAGGAAPAAAVAVAAAAGSGGAGSAGGSRADWDLGTFLRMVQGTGLEGVCNAVSAAYLAGMIAPQIDGPGVGERNFKQVVFLKHLLDAIVRDFHAGQDSGDVTQAFLTWARARSLNAAWLANLTSAIANEQARDFRQFFLKMNAAQHPAASAKVAGRFEDLTSEYLYSTFDGLLEPFFDMRNAFEGVVVMKTSTLREDSDAPDPAGPQGNHQFAIRYDPAGNSLFIYDQNGGLERHGIVEQEDIADVLANYLYRYYIERPFRPRADRPAVNYGSFEMRIFP